MMNINYSIHKTHSKILSLIFFAIGFLFISTTNLLAEDRFKSEKQIIKMGLGTAYNLYVDEEECVMTLASKENFYLLHFSSIDIKNTSFKTDGLIGKLKFQSRERAKFVHFEIDNGKPKSRNELNEIDLLTTTIGLDIFQEEYKNRYNEEYPFEERLIGSLKKIRNEC